MILELNHSCHTPFKWELWYHLLFIVFSKYYLATLVELSGENFPKTTFKLFIFNHYVYQLNSNSKGKGGSKWIQLSIFVLLWELGGDVLPLKSTLRTAPITHTNTHIHTEGRGVGNVWFHSHKEPVYVPLPVCWQKPKYGSYLTFPVHVRTLKCPQKLVPGPFPSKLSERLWTPVSDGGLSGTTPDTTLISVLWFTRKQGHTLQRVIPELI